MSPAVTHPAWCARTHRCGLGEHRAAPVTLTGLGSTGAVRVVAVVTRVLSPTGHQHVDIRLRIALPRPDAAARRRLVGVLAELQTLLTRLARPGHPARRA